MTVLSVSNLSKTFVGQRVLANTLRKAGLPEEGYGHILMGGPGPILMYRIGPNAIRACIDVPRQGFAPGRAREYLWQAYAPWFPASTRTASTARPASPSTGLHIASDAPFEPECEDRLPAC